jgi:pyridoxal phosphate enzyme (YggS family)
MQPAGEQRRAELVGTLAAVRGVIADACAAAGRDTRSVTLVAVTKTYPATDVHTLLDLGVLDIGESRDQEAAAKVAEVAAGLSPHSPVPRWHFVGQLQRRKCRSVAGYAAAVHSVDRPELVAALDEGADRAGRAGIEVFVQVSLDGDPHRGGIAADGVADLADAVATAQRLHLRGVMAVAPMHADPDQAFAELAAVSHRLRAAHPEAGAISAGMSGDLAAAVKNGATHVRVGSALLGRRGPVVG